jgi:hypothetical protein
LLVLAIYNLKGNEALLARQLAAILKRTVYEASSRVRAPGGGPSVIASFAEPRAAHAAAAALEARGFDVLLLDATEIETERRRFVVWRCELGDETMRLEARPAVATGTDATLVVPYAGIDLLLRGVTIVTRKAVVPTTTRRLSLVRAALTGGLMLTKSVRPPRPPPVEEREGFLHLYTRGMPPLAWREDRLQYRSLGKALLPSRHANFAQVVAELRRRCPGATYDERLATRAGQAQLLGPTLSSDDHLDVAISVLAAALRKPAG